ncbi:MAG: mechanosensitive ion channel family protein [Acidobacteria bacterium]|nr:mechanosensitive ion channel family protein [Acidobacteriota bacterium]
MPRNHFKRRLIIFLVGTALLVLSLVLVSLSQSSLKAYIIERMLNYRMSPEAAEASFNNVLNLVYIILWMALAIVLIRAINSLIFGLVFRLRKGYEAPNLVRNTFSIVAYIIIFVILFKQFYPKVELGALFTTSAIFGVIIGLALQDTLGNLFAGISLQADKPFQVGDVITVGKWTGVVESVTWRGIKLRTFQNHVVLISNSSAGKEAIEVCPRENLNARIVFFNTLYTDSPAKTIHIVREAVREADNVSQKIRPIVRIRDFGDSSVDFEVKYWLEDYTKFNDTDALVRQRIWYAFRRAGINFAFPTRTVQIERISKADGRRADGSEFIDRLNAVDIFAPLSAEETARLAKNSVRRVFAPGESVIRAGDEGSSMFVVHEGRVSVQISDNGKPRTVSVLNEGDFFGEMALFTGEPRTASVVAIEETEVLEIGFQAMKHLFDTNPDLVESLSHTITERRAELKARSEDVQESEDEAEGLLSVIKRFFGIS